MNLLVWELQTQRSIVNLNTERNFPICLYHTLPIPKLLSTGQLHALRNPLKDSRHPAEAQEFLSKQDTNHNVNKTPRILHQPWTKARDSPQPFEETIFLQLIANYYST